jgi:hypothetical protein
MTATCLTCMLALGLLGAVSAPAETIRGWLACDRCTLGRIRDGNFTPNNPECARQCIAQGAKTVLIDGGHKRFFYVANPEAANPNIGNYVEIEGSLDAASNAVHIDSLKLLEKGVASCSRKRTH